MILLAVLLMMLTAPVTAGAPVDVPNRDVPITRLISARAIAQLSGGSSRELAPAGTEQASPLNVSSPGNAERFPNYPTNFAIGGSGP